MFSSQDELSLIEAETKMAAILQMIFSNAVYWMKTFEFQMIFHVFFII